MKLSKLPKILPGMHPAVPEELGELDVQGVAHDSRRVKPGWVFVAVTGHQRDGAAFIADAISRGAAAIVSERPARVTAPVLFFLVQDARRALAALASSFHGRPSRKLQVIGVTGTNGKTTTTYMIRSILQAAGKRCGVLGTISYETGKRTVSASITTPESVDIQEYLAEMVTEGMEYAAIEVSSHSLCMNRVDLVQFAGAAFTNLSPEHMDYHRTLTAYRDAKARLFRSLGPATFAALNADDRSSKAIAEKTGASEILWYGVSGAGAAGLKDGPQMALPGTDLSGADPAFAAAKSRAPRLDVCATVRQATLDGVEMTLATEAGEVDVKLPLIGVHNVYNALAAASVASALGCGLDAVAAGLGNAPIVPGRLEPVPCEKGCKVLVDFAHTDGALKSVLDSLRGVTSKKIIVVFGAGGDRDRTKRPRMGRVVEQGADMAWVTSDNPRGEEPLQIINEILAGMKKRGDVHVQPDRQAAIAEALHAAGPGDLVLIAGKGHERTQRFKDTVIPFDDREAVRIALM